MKRSPSILHLIVLALLLWGGEYVWRDFWEPDEARYAYVAREMRETGQWAVPHRHGVYYAHKPPLMFWLINAGATITGGEITPLATRLPSLFGALLSLSAVVGMARLWCRRHPDAGTEGAPESIATAWRAVLILMTTYLFWNKGGMGQIDSLLCGLEMVAVYQLIAYEDSRRVWRPLLAYSAMGMAILAKGPVGFAVPFGMYIASIFAARDRAPDSDTPRQRRCYAHMAWGPLLVLLLPAAWLAWVYTHNPPPGYLQELLFKQNIDRAAGELGHVKPFYFYLVHFPLEFLPWTALWCFIPAAYRFAGPASAGNRVALRRLLAMAAFVVVFFSLSPSKRELYILPAYPPMALAVALSWPAVARHTGKALIRFWSGLLGVAGLVVIGGAIVDAVTGVLPLHGASLLVPGALAVAGSAWLQARYRREGRYTDAIFLGFVAAMLALQISVGAIVYPAANAMKAPYTVATAAGRYLAPDDPILLFRMNGEIMALYARRPGRGYTDPRELERAIRRRGHGLVVMERRARANIPPALSAHAEEQTFRMGNKTLVWMHVDLRGP
ncbi:MAG: hypothetical protein K8T26_00770 [Lentisphaerae bacterium]|nr:hypothetical protein [Lentisphaerota bacterium]